MLPSTHTAQHAERDRLSVLLAVTLVSATLFRFVEIPDFVWGVRQVFGSPLSFTFDSDWMLSLLMMGLVATGTLSLMQGHPLYKTRERGVVFFLIVPALGALLISLLLVQAQLWPVWMATLLLGALLLGLLIHLSYRAFSPESPGYPSARTLLNIIDYLVGFLLFSLVLQSQDRALVTGPAIFLLSGLLALELLSATGAAIKDVALFSGIIALLTAQMAWVFGFWNISAWTAATLLTLGLYLWSGIGYQYLLDRLTRQVVLEFVLVVALMLALVLWIRP